MTQNPSLLFKSKKTYLGIRRSPLASQVMRQVFSATQETPGRQRWQQYLPFPTPGPWHWDIGEFIMIPLESQPIQATFARKFAYWICSAQGV